MKKKSDNPFAQIPQVERMLSDRRIAAFGDLVGRKLLARITADTLDEIRSAGKRGEAIPSADECKDAVAAACERYARMRIMRVVNATGVVLHTNLGRSPLPETVWDSARRQASEYSSIEFDLNGGRRGGRFEFLRRALCCLTDAEDALIVNNNAAAVFLMLTAFARGKEVIVARGQQVQIGGGFRIPEILRLAGCTLVEVGTTNITTLQDITAAVSDITAMVLWVHTSNYTIRGFTDMPTIKAIKEALPPHVLLAVDQGSGNISMDIPDEPTVQSVLAEGADMVCFSGDKLLGGVQAGLIVGRADYVGTVSRHPLMRTYRVGKTIAALMEETLVYFLNGGRSAAERAFFANPGELYERGAAIMRSLPTDVMQLVQLPCSLGGGSTPDRVFPSWALQERCESSAEKHKAVLRAMNPPVIAIITQGLLTVHLAAVRPDDDALLTDALLNLYARKGAHSCY